jgi:hypothetical protein
VPTANSAAPNQPIKPTDHTLVVDHKPHRRRLTAMFGLSAVLALGIGLPAQTLAAPEVAGRASPNSCSSWSSTTRPPTHIRVLKRSTGRVVRVPFKSYVVTVMGKEWPSYLPQPVVEAGAVAVKQYGWYHAMGRSHVSRRGQCYDVTDGVRDQLYKPGKARVRPDHHRAADKTWGVRLIKNGKLFMTGYRRGSARPCGRDHTGWKLYARSAVRCARAGHNYLSILRRYYGPNLEIVNGGASSSRSSQSWTGGSSSVETFRVIDDRSRSVVWRGSWRRVRAGNALGNTLTYSGSAGSSATFRFTGTRLELVGRRGPNRGLVDVYVNGRRLARVDMYAAGKRPQSTFFTQTWSTAEPRAVRLVVVGSAGRPRVDLDAIRVR